MSSLPTRPLAGLKMAGPICNPCLSHTSGTFGCGDPADLFISHEMPLQAFDCWGMS